MIITITPNPALDITYAVASLTLGESHRISDVVERAGGKGLNVAAVLTSMGRDTIAVAPVGADDRSRFATDLDIRGVPHQFVDSPNPTRRSIAVVEATGRATLFNEQGAAQPTSVWDAVSQRVSTLAAPGSVLTVSGSLPPGFDPEWVRHLVEGARAAGVLTVLDISGPSLLRALAAGPTLVKPNRSEACETLASIHGGASSSASPGEELLAVAAARALVEAGARCAVVSDGADGITVVHEDLILRGWLPTPLRGNPTGAGDALTAALAADLDSGGGLPHGRDAWADVLRRGVAWSAAAVLQLVAGIIDEADVIRLLPTVAIEEITP